MLWLSIFYQYGVSEYERSRTERNNRKRRGNLFRMWENSFLIDEIRGEIICRNCGIVNRGKLIDYVER